MAHVSFLTQQSGAAGEGGEGLTAGPLSAARGRDPSDPPPQQSDALHEHGKFQVVFPLYDSDASQISTEILMKELWVWPAWFISCLCI